MLLQSVQRYKFESNSQPYTASSVIQRSCCNQYKDTNLKAIHNSHAAGSALNAVVAISTKIQIWKQFTTQDCFRSYELWLLQSVQRYKFESNSQRFSVTHQQRRSCCNQYKDTNLKAIHNSPSLRSVDNTVVAISTKIQIWKQFTTGLEQPCSWKVLLQSVQRYKFESNSQRGK